jgi:hypothetical protein
MPDDVWPISAEHPGPRSLRSTNRIGFEFKGFTRKDDDGYCFATRWFMVFGLPIAPLDRYYVRERGIDPARTDHSVITTRYEIAGRSPVRPAEVARTYAFGWLTPVAIIAPLLALLARADDLPFWLPLVALVVWPLTTIPLTVAMLMYYRDYLAPRREPRWHGRRRPS